MLSYCQSQTNCWVSLLSLTPFTDWSPQLRGCGKVMKKWGRCQNIRPFTWPGCAWKFGRCIPNKFKHQFWYRKHADNPLDVWVMIPKQIHLVCNQPMRLSAHMPSSSLLGSSQPFQKTLSEWTPCSTRAMLVGGRAPLDPLVECNSTKSNCQFEVSASFSDTPTLGVYQFETANPPFLHDINHHIYILGGSLSIIEPSCP